MFYVLKNCLNVYLLAISKAIQCVCVYVWTCVGIIDQQVWLFKFNTDYRINRTDRAVFPDIKYADCVLKLKA